MLKHTNSFGSLGLVIFEQLPRMCVILKHVYVISLSELLGLQMEDGQNIYRLKETVDTWSPKATMEISACIGTREFVYFCIRVCV